ncbi:ImmA/IrrE family metallo-endopeptidase [Sinimarinibacterium sp. CAU 1509]|uniref:helix-turn-helix domain-containing protein n=1 Tax=Sinimarinibacterium sp. CAU 1509 TaxID=2562283 RepID=UPI0010ACADAB|nr:XRE family transcriptional regulator [Sinimarinibacterium sp. CAU 1509]TJY56269.1 ImmA/IrrE family metallo-endopeptidase [Sinimarinibacterium sp. CAU 1509]
MSAEFIGDNLRLIRLFHGLSLTELGERVNVSKQYLSRLEAGEPMTAQLESALVDELKVLPEFFYAVEPEPIADDQCHFRSQLTTKPALRQIGRARGEMLKRLVRVLDNHLDLPAYQIGAADASTIENIERGAEEFRKRFGLGLGPLSNITRTAENAGAVVTMVDGLAPEIDAVSFATKRPVIALNAGGRSACRQRFGIAHELGHFALHHGVLTGDRLTETQANRFASALLLPRSSFGADCRHAVRGSRLNWKGISELKKKWGTSKAAIIFRGHQLGHLNEAQVRTGFIFLRRHGEAIEEVEDRFIAHESPSVLVDGLMVMREQLNLPMAYVAREMKVQVSLLYKLSPRLQQPMEELQRPNVVSIFRSRQTA